MLNPRPVRFVASILCLLNSHLAAHAADSSTNFLRLEPHDRVAVEAILPASDGAELAMKKFSLPAGFRASVFAAEPMLANPVAFCLDEKGRVFVSETHRFNTSVLDIRHYMPMLDADLACRKVEDRIPMSEKFFGPAAKDLAIESEVVRFLEDRDGDGRADFSSVYADGFNSMLDGIASGVLAHHGKVWFANIPDVVELDGMDKNGRAKNRKVFSHGYGVRYSYTGHDLHGLILGPDGKLYFSFGDRGANVKTKEGNTLFFPDEGAVFRCNQDGSGLEVVHHGLRNPQELAFDEFGNLFTGDNDFDHGDHERWVYVVEGADSGWRVGYQHPPLGYDNVPWMLEKLWVPHFPGQAAYIVPPIANIDDGPSGLTYYPGTGMPSKFDGHFFLCQFKGEVTRSGIRTFSVEPRGASFELVNSEPFLWNVEATDVDFGPDSQLYLSDWGEGWERNRKGRIYRVAETNAIRAPVVAETKKLLAEGFEKTSQRDLLKYLSHANMKVRLEAQFALADLGQKSAANLIKLAASHSSDPRARRHSIWALGQIGRNDAKTLQALLPLLGDADAEIRAQSAKVLGDEHFGDAFDGLARLLKDSSPRVRFFAAQSLGKLKRTEAVEPLLVLLRDNNDGDMYLRHAAATALAKCANTSQLATAAKDDSAAVRMGVLLAMRQTSRPEIAEFLKDRDELLVVEAARAINDVPIAAAMPKLAALISGGKRFTAEHEVQYQALQLRVVNANSRMGSEASALALASYASQENAPAAAAAEAVAALGNWADPGTRDRIVGVYRPFDGARDSRSASNALGGVIAKILSASSSDPVKLAAIEAVEKLKIIGAANPLNQLFVAQTDPENIRLAALQVLGKLDFAGIADTVKVAQADKSELIRKEANRLGTKIDPQTAVVQIRSVLEKGSIPEKQGAITSLGTIASGEAVSALSGLLDKLVAGELARDLELELFEAVAKQNSPELKAKLKNYESKASGPLAKFQQALFGGNADAGKKIFFERPEASCVRCHKINNEGGDVGPVLTGVGSRKPREYLLESMVLPNAQIAPGFESLLLTMKDGQSFAGVFKSENEKELVINSPEDGPIKIAKENIKTRARGNSGMVEVLGEILSRRDLRDLVEFLAASK
ncbi:MAG: HEAT repeat domain-containing protein [Verrucomicrobiota bacterium]